MTPEQWESMTLEQSTPEQWKAAAISAGHREAKAVAYAMKLEGAAFVLLICNLVLLFEGYV